MSVIEETQNYVEGTPLSISSKSSKSSRSNDSSSRESEVEFADVVEKLSFAIDNVKQLKPWKDKALKFERLNKQLNTTITRMRAELSDAEYELQKWKKRAVRAEKENQDEILKWKNQVRYARKTVLQNDFDKREDDDLLPDENETYTNLVSEKDDDNTTISTHRYDDSKSIQELTGKSFRDKWEKMGFNDIKESSASVRSEDDNSTIAAQELIKQYQKGHGFSPSRQIPDDSSTVAAEKIMKQLQGGNEFTSSPRRAVADDSSNASSGFMRKYDMGSLFNSPHGVAEENSTTSSPDILSRYGRGKDFDYGSSRSRVVDDGSSRRIGDDSSGLEAEDILNNYLSMKGRFNSRRFDSNRVESNRAVVVENEI